jgi:CubicO group peptidase (beta-lactamase class C family)
VLSHTAGFPNWRGGDAALKIFFTPGEKFSYSGEGFVYLSKVIEHITGEKFNDFMKRTVFDPVAMTNSAYVWQRSYDEQKTSRHNSLGELSPQIKPSTANAAASLHTTAEDYARFVAAVLNGAGLKKETHAQMLTSQIKVDEAGTNMTNRPADKLSPSVSWGLGVGLQTTQDGVSFWRWGDNGDAGLLCCVPAAETWSSSFANSANGLITELIDEAVGDATALGWIKPESYKSPRRLLLKDIVANGGEAALLSIGNGERAALQMIC